MTDHIIAFLILSAGSLAALAQTGDLEVHLQGVEHARGSVRVGLYSDPSSFRKEERAVSVLQAQAAPGTVVVRFRGVAAGRYAIMAYHDEDGNGELNRRFGMFPTEGYGLSNNPSVSGPPAFEDSAFEVDAGPAATVIGIDVRY